MTDPPDAAQLRFRQLFLDQHDKVLGFLLRRVGSRTDADDLVAETFLVAWRRLPDVPAGSEALPWLYAVARHPAVIRWRKTISKGIYADPELVQMPSVVPDNWYVRFAFPLKPGEVMVQVAPTPGIPGRVAGG